MLAAKLERIQYRACLIICGALNLTSYDRMLLDLGWPKIKYRVDFLRVSLFYKAINGFACTFFSNLILWKCTHHEIAINLRAPPLLCQPLARMEQYFNSFIPTACRQWNFISPNLKSASSPNSFKSQYKKRFFLSKVLVYDMGSRKKSTSFQI
jgi:hypothetical protein